MASDRTREELTLIPHTQGDAERWEESRRRRRMLEGQWHQDLAEYLAEVLALDRISNLGRLSRGINLFGSVVRQVSVLYDRSPDLRIAEATDEQAAAFAEMLETANTWQLAARNSEYVVGLRESLIKVEWSESREVVTLRLVPSDTVVAKADANDPEHVTEIREGRIRTLIRDGTPTRVSTWDVWSIEDGGSLRVLEADGTDITAEVLGDAAQAYPYVDEDGPYLPWVLYHAQAPAKLWDPYAWCELVDGALDVAVLWSLYHKIARDASWNQKYVVDLELAGLSYASDGGATAGKITTSPDSVLVFRSHPEKGGSAGSFQVAADPEDFVRSVLTYQRTLVSTMGIHPADVEKTQSAESGVAIQLKRSAQRRMALRMEPNFRGGDERLLSIMGRVHNLFSSAPDLPTEGFAITYHPVDDGVADAMERHAFLREQVRDGLMSRVEWYKTIHPEATFEEAMTALFEASAIQRALEDPSVLEQALAGSVTDKDDLLAASMDTQAPQPQIPNVDADDTGEEDDSE